MILRACGEVLPRGSNNMYLRVYVFSLHDGNSKIPRAFPHDGSNILFLRASLLRDSNSNVLSS